MHGKGRWAIPAMVGLTACVCFAAVGVSRRGRWPDTWPDELEPCREQAETRCVGHGISETVHTIHFTDRDAFEKAWPHIIGLKSTGAPLLLERGPFCYSVSGSETVCGVMIRTPTDGVTGRRLPQVETMDDLDEPLRRGTALRTAPPWPDYLYSETGELPEYVHSEEQPDGALKWVPCKSGTRTALRHRSRVGIILVTDGEVIDLNRIQFPSGTPVIDNRFDNGHKTGGHIR